MFRLSLIVIFVSISIFASAQNKARIEGYVIDTTGAPLQGVTVDILNKDGVKIGRNALSNGKGGYAVVGLNGARYDLQFSMKDYSSVIVHGVIVKSDQETLLNIILHPVTTPKCLIVEYKEPIMDRVPFLVR